MQLSEIFLGLGEPALAQLLKSISLGKLKTFQLYERIEARLHVRKLNSETLKKSAPYAWQRLSEHDEDFATEISQAILISHMDMIRAVLEELHIPNEDGFFAKDLDAKQYLTEGWQQRVWDRFHDRFPAPLLLFYINHLGWETAKQDFVFSPNAVTEAAQ